MALTAPVIPFLRPLGLSQASIIRQSLRFSTCTACRIEVAAKGEDPNLVASRSASATYPPSSMKSLPRPKESRASHRTNHPRPTRAYPTRQPTHSPVPSPRLTPSPIEPLPPAQCAPNLAYFVTRTSSNELPVYLLRKRGGNLKLTLVRKIDGRPEALRDELRQTLGLQEDQAMVNPVTKHVVLKGHFKNAVVKFLRERMF
ncbi:hypothetical protein M433DRAFT_152944 [Acidomyces richmondensis BFW]|nr:MAG: hypothetical protein FE78DRAFT_106141 [Acidomyces sp. 'richmondensis']KYG46801.1 hypothetical protein M433DRAFT_152944 [Acidomyces richmondensis BFW]